MNAFEFECRKMHCVTSVNAFNSSVIKYHSGVDYTIDLWMSSMLTIAHII